MLLGHNIFIYFLDLAEGLTVTSDYDLSSANLFKYYVIGGNHNAAS